MFEGFTDAMDAIKRTTREVGKTREAIRKNQKAKNILWVAEMSLKYDKKPEYVIELLDKISVIVKERTKDAKGDTASDQH